MSLSDIPVWQRPLDSRKTLAIERVAIWLPPPLPH